MKKAFLTTSALVMLGGGAFAADLNTKAQPYAPAAAPVAAYPWNGMFIGGTIGGTWDNSDVGVGASETRGAVTNSASASASGSGSGLSYGIELGYNYQVSPNWLLGIVTDYQFDTASQGLGTGIQNLTVTSKMPEFGTTRIRFGYIWNGNVLFYGTGGVAYGIEQLSAVETFGPVNGPPAGSFGGNLNSGAIGWTAGAGVEYMFVPNWSVKAEYLHVDMKAWDASIGGGTPTNNDFVSVNTHMTTDLVRGGIAYHF